MLDEKEAIRWLSDNRLVAKVGAKTGGKARSTDIKWSGWGRVLAPFMGGHLKRLRGSLAQKTLSRGRQPGQNADVAKIETGRTLLSPLKLVEHVRKIADDTTGFDLAQALSGILPDAAADDDVACLVVAAATAALAAGEKLAARDQPSTIVSGSEKAIRTQQDIDAQEDILNALATCGLQIAGGKRIELPPLARQMARGLGDRAFANDTKVSVFGEEQPDATQIDGSLVAVIDPCDGTTNYVAGIDTYCVGVAFCRIETRGDKTALRPLCAAVYHPPRGELFVGIIGSGGVVIDVVKRAIAPMRPRRNGVLREAVVASHLTSQTEAMMKFVASPLPHLCTAVRRVLMFGSGLLQLAWVAAGRLDAFLQPVAGGSWDVIPGAILVASAGGAVTACDGTFDAGGAFRLDGTSVLAAGNSGLHRNLATIVTISESFPMRT